MTAAPAVCRLLLLASLIAQLCGCEDRLAPEQPIPFSHKIHLGEKLAAELGEGKLVCTNCHVGAEAKAQAGLPPVRYCLRCHMKPQGEEDDASELERQVRKLAAAKGPFRWIQVNRNPGHVYFSHVAHTVGAKITCFECHGDVRSWAEPPRRPVPKLHSMRACMKCHRQRGASNACMTCHR